jgi:hypothetical protein
MIDFHPGQKDLIDSHHLVGRSLKVRKKDQIPLKQKDLIDLLFILKT